MLKMKTNCERCKITITKNQLAYICSYECTFCENCTKIMDAICPNCSGELLQRPIRLKNPVQVMTFQAKTKLFNKRSE